MANSIHEGGGRVPKFTGPVIYTRLSIIDHIVRHRVCSTLIERGQTNETQHPSRDRLSAAAGNPPLLPSQQIHVVGGREGKALSATRKTRP